MVDTGLAGGERLRCIVYCSTPRDDWPEAGLPDLVRQSRVANGKNAITGQLIYVNRQFTQLLEGPEERVEELFAAILRDPRHHHVRLLLRRDVGSRAFAAWDLAVDTGDTQGVLSAGTDHAWSAGRLDTDWTDVWGADLPADAALLRQPVQQDRARRTVERIFHTARGIVLRAGAGGLTVADLTQKAAITEPTFYRYFNGVDDLMRVGVTRLAMRRLHDWQAVIHAHHFNNDVELADLVATLGTRHFLNMRGAPTALVRAALPHMDGVMSAVAPPFAATLLHAMARCRLPGAADIDVNMMTAIMAGLMRMATHMAAEDMARLRTEQTRRVAAAIFLAGLRAAQGR